MQSFLDSQDLNVVISDLEEKLLNLELKRIIVLEIGYPDKYDDRGFPYIFGDCKWAFGSVWSMDEVVYGNLIVIGNEGSKCAVLFSDHIFLYNSDRSPLGWYNEKIPKIPFFQNEQMRLEFDNYVKSFGNIV